MTSLEGYIAKTDLVDSEKNKFVFTSLFAIFLLISSFHCLHIVLPGVPKSLHVPKFDSKSNFTALGDGWRGGGGRQLEFPNVGKFCKHQLESD